MACFDVVIKVTMPRKRQPADGLALPDLIRRHLAAKAHAKKLYDRADALLAEIAKHMKPNQEVELSATGKKAVLIDNWAGKMVVWGHGGVRHYEIEVIDL